MLIKYYYRKTIDANIDADFHPDINPDINPDIDANVHPDLNAKGNPDPCSEDTGTGHSEYRRQRRRTLGRSGNYSGCSRIPGISSEPEALMKYSRII